MKYTVEFCTNKDHHASLEAEFEWMGRSGDPEYDSRNLAAVTAIYEAYGYHEEDITLGEIAPADILTRELIEAVNGLLAVVHQFPSDFEETWAVERVLAKIHDEEIEDEIA